jgi:hypothetical protein
MAKTFTAPFAQTPKTNTAVVTAACADIHTTPTNTSLLVTAGADGAIVTSLTATPRGTVTASSLVLFLSKDSGTTLHLIGSALMGAQTVSTTAGITSTSFSIVSETTPIRLEAGDRLYAGSQVALAAGIVFKAEWTDF